MSEREYIHGNEADDDDLLAFDRGELVEWRRGPDGCMWYRRRIHTEAVAPEIMAVEGDDDIEAEDVELADDAGYDPPATLDDFERAQLRQWADDLRRRASEGFDDATDE